ncbi:MalY/PatB family protein [Corynebacterium gerontici]|uniref:cysteine-S-conjugate beta-lyase n=1 Tax=Corynebacterium gerontici TaxID=2079234 RepID=A0A3G6J2H2_9CORY|nr:MalY/PatB family protein [Corynebacterium gerontici]AZA11903.1 Cystathionine beta-lyase PatB [Corynebacterium gerontici]
MDFPSYEQLSKRGTMKWSRHSSDVIPLWVAESDFSTCPPIHEAMRRAVEEERFGYPPSPEGLQQACANFHRERYSFDARPEWIFPLPDVVRGLYVGINEFTEPGSPVVVLTPAYPPFYQVLQACGREGIFIDVSEGLDFDALDRAFNAAGAMLLCNPHNPLGFAWSREQLERIVELAQRHNVRLLVDEIHAPLVYEGTHVAAASISEAAANRCITITATSKAWNTAGLKCAQIIFSNAEDVRHWESLSPVTKDGVSTLGLLAAETAYAKGVEFLDEELDYLRSNRDYLMEAIPRMLPGAKVRNIDATYLLWIDFRDCGLDLPGEFFLNNARVALNEGTMFGDNGRGFARLNFATSRELLDEALQRMANALAAHNGE